MDFFFFGGGGGVCNRPFYSCLLSDLVSESAARLEVTLF